MAGSKDAWLQAISIIIILTGILSNGIVVLVLTAKSSRRILQKWRNMYILHQSIVDITTLVIVALLRLINIDHETFHTDSPGVLLLCKLWVSEYFLWSLLTCSTYNLALLSLERYLAVVHPIYHRTKLTKNKILITMLLPWVLGFGIQSYWPPMNHLDTDNGTCYPLYNCDHGTPSNLQRFLSIYSFTFEYGIALMIMVFCYSQIIIKLTLIINRKKKNRPNVQQKANTQHTEDGVESRNKNVVYAITKAASKKPRDVFSEAKRDIIKTFLAVFLSYAACWTPTEVVYLRHNLCIKELDFESGLYYGLSILVVLNAVINPFIYSGLYVEFQKQLKRVVLKCPSKRRAGGRNGSDEASSFGTAPMSNIQSKKGNASSCNGREDSAIYRVSISD